MISRIYLSTVALAMLAAPAFAADNKCASPIAPAMPSDGKAAYGRGYDAGRKGCRRFHQGLGPVSVVPEGRPR